MRRNLMGGVDISLPNVSYCEDVKDVHYNPYNTVEFYVGEITPTQTVQIYTDETNSIPIQVSKGNKWYTYLLPKDKGLYKINGSAVKKVVVKADILIGNSDTIIPDSIIEASFKGSNTSKVTNMISMFENCTNLTSLDVSSFDTSNVTDMANMFDECTSLTSLDLSDWDTSKVTDMNYMFYNCNSLTSLTLSNFDTSNVISMDDMFDNCTNLTSLTLSGLDTSNVTYMQSMFNNCSGLKSLDLSGWDTSNVTYMNNMFKNCTALKTIRMVGCSQTTIDKIKAQLTTDGIINNVNIITEKK